MRSGRKALSAALATGVIGMGAIAAASTAGAAPVPPACQITTFAYELTHLDGSSEYVTRILGNPSPIEGGDQITVMFQVPATCTDGVTLSIASYRTAELGFAPAEQQVLWDSESALFRPGPHTMTVDVFGGADGDPADCAVQHHSNTGRGANQSGPYDSTCDGSASLNGNGGGNASGRPCAGCVGNADDRNPPGQMPTGNDANAGYECDRNNGVGRTNPAHTGCQHAQVDFVYGDVLPTLSPTIMYGDRKIDWANI